MSTVAPEEYVPAAETQQVYQFHTSAPPAFGVTWSPTGGA